MSAESLFPGVFVEEVAFGAQSIEGVATSTSTFVAALLAQSAAFRALDEERQRAISADVSRVVATLGTRFFDGRLLTDDDLDEEQDPNRPDRE